jgi:2-polyprenyl-3-methyl-5-hydroxy-6-metoxy-1,4-benzoquinol methylase
LNYEGQQKYFRHSRTIGAFSAAAVLLTGAFVMGSSADAAVPIALIGIALALSIFYSADYLHLSVAPTKATRWAIMLRWRIAALILLYTETSWIFFGKPSARPVLISVAWILIANALAKFIPQRFISTWLLGNDFALIAVATLMFQLHLVIAAALLALASHLFSVTAKHSFAGSIVALAAILINSLARHTGQGDLVDSCFFLLIVAAIATVAMVQEAVKRNNLTVSEAVIELATFTGYSENRITELWATSNQLLARNWEAAKLDESDAAKMATWYRENSELYMFAISAYNLEYKRIKSNLAMMKYGRGKCLDYGAGNGELILEMGRRGHSAVYYDVEGTSMLFARSRAEQRKLNIEFCASKECLRNSSERSAFNTIFSFDVLEHIPDLAGELDFLASLLAPGGLMVFDVPAGSTKAHPMHLNHNLDVRAHLLAKGMTEEKLGWSFRKQEKYLFRKPV